MGPGLICPQLPKSPVATFTFTTALFVSILQMDRLRLGAQKKIQEESGEQRSLEKVELMGSRSPDAAGGWDSCFVPCDLCPGWAGHCSPTTEALGPGLLHLGPWKSPKQELGVERLVICSQSHLVCIPAAEP